MCADRSAYRRTHGSSDTLGFAKSTPILASQDVRLSEAYQQRILGDLSCFGMAECCRRSGFVQVGLSELVQRDTPLSRYLGQRGIEPPKVRAIVRLCQTPVFSSCILLSSAILSRGRFSPVIRIPIRVPMLDLVLNPHLQSAA
jgi:hypothetical protein